MSYDVTRILSTGNDFYNGRQRQTHDIDGDTGSDIVSGGAGADRLFGNIGNDTLMGRAGDDILLGGVGTDVLMGGRGNDILTGGGGLDIFRFAATLDNGNTDFVTDWSRGDVLEINKLAKAVVTISQGDAGAGFQGTDLANDAGLADSRIDVTWGGGSYTLWVVDAQVTLNDLVLS